MKKASTLLAALLVSFVAVAHAQGTAPTQPTTSAGAATTVQTSPAATESKGKADTGLATAEKNITAKHGKTSKANGMTEKTEHAVKPERPAMPERPSR